ncbi:hypothetical protein DER44DRAFT_536504 [Fusarium oxysporum]|nr:hypothetical protein DER44DRAFT_536504 [Fusarium oxysporum]
MNIVFDDMIKLVRARSCGLKAQDSQRKPSNSSRHYRQWGFTIYRTYYGVGSDKSWDMLLDALRRQTRLAFGHYDDEKDISQDNIQRLKELFYIDAREDPSLLDGLDVRGIRQFCKQEKPDDDRVMANRLYHFALLADESVLKDVSEREFVVKAVSLKWSSGHLGWGWMRIPTSYLLDLWLLLMLNRHRTEGVLFFKGPEEDLEDYVWPGDLALDYTGCCSEVRQFRHYHGQSPDRTN